MAKIYVLNYRNEREPFSFKKVYNSAKRVGASGLLAKRIARIIEREVYPGIRTSEIFQRVKSLLSKENLALSLRFNLKEAMRKLGPTGFPFEKYIGEIFSNEGFKVKLNQHLPGKCLRYEIDFIAEKDNLVYVGECKYRNLPEGIVNSEVALSNYARFLDLREGSFFKKKFRNFQIKTILVTNTKFTKSAIRFSKCKNTCLLGWKYPRMEGLEYFIDTQNLYPVTILPSFKKDLFKIFVSKKMMLVKDVLKIKPEEFAKKEKIAQRKLNQLIKEAKTLLEN